MRRRVLSTILAAGLGLSAAVVALAPPASATTDSTVQSTCTRGNFRVVMKTTYRYLLGDVNGVPTWFVKIASGSVSQYRYNGASWAPYDWATYWTLTTGVDSTTEETHGENPTTTDSHTPLAPGYVSPSRKVWTKWAVTGAASCTGYMHDDSQDAFL